MGSKVSCQVAEDTPGGEGGTAEIEGTLKRWVVGAPEAERIAVGVGPSSDGIAAVAAEESA